MKAKSLGNSFLVLGILLLIGAVFWWASFYGPIVTSCIYSQAGICGLTQNVAQFVGKSNPYNPILCWVGGASVLVGLALRLSR
jgi:hypothetical protein